MTTSIVMATYNGEKYLIPQMESLRRQTLQIDEVIIMDDCSTDKTVELIEEYIRNNKLKTWKIVKNHENKGWKENFKNGFDLAKGSYIFPCDQDDVWHLDKCRIMIDIMESNPEIDVLSSNYTLIFSENDRGSTSYIRNADKMTNDGKLQIIKLTPKWPYIYRPGCTFCFRKKFYDEINPEWNVHCAHDAILWRYSIIRGSLAIYNKPLIDFRRHGDNTTSIKERSKEERVNTFREYLYFHEVALMNVRNEKDRKVINKGIDFLNTRISIYNENRIWLLIKLVICYYEYYSTIRGFFGDIYFCLGKNKYCE